jgi:hypothetical protein
MNKNASTNNKYTPPTFNKHIKKEPKNVFCLNLTETSFPSLTIPDIKSNNNTLNFSNVLTNESKTVNTLLPNTLLPGWIYIEKVLGKIQYKYGRTSSRYNCSSDNFDYKLGKVMFKNRLAREQNEINKDIERLGDLSEFYGNKPLAELYEEEYLKHSFVIDENNNSSDDVSDYELDNYNNNYNNNKFEICNQ